MVVVRVCKSDNRCWNGKNRYGTPTQNHKISLTAHPSTPVPALPAPPNVAPFHLQGARGVSNNDGSEKFAFLVCIYVYYIYIHTYIYHVYMTHIYTYITST